MSGRKGDGVFHFSAATIGALKANRNTQRSDATYNIIKDSGIFWEDLYRFMLNTLRDISQLVSFKADFFEKILGGFEDPEIPQEVWQLFYDEQSRESVAHVTIDIYKKNQWIVKSHMILGGAMGQIIHASTGGRSSLPSYTIKEADIKEIVSDWVDGSYSGNVYLWLADSGIGEKISRGDIISQKTHEIVNWLFKKGAYSFKYCH